MEPQCNLFWGSHGCDMPPGHEGDHTCATKDPYGPCSQYRDADQHVRFTEHPLGERDDDPPTWSDWHFWGESFR